MLTLTQRTSPNTRITHHWLDMLEEHHVRYMSLDPQHDKKLIEVLRTRPEWLIEFADKDAIFFVRDELPLAR